MVGCDRLHEGMAMDLSFLLMALGSSRSTDNEPRTKDGFFSGYDHMGCGAFIDDNQNVNSFGVGIELTDRL